MMEEQDYMRELGRNIRVFRTQTKMTQGQLAEAIGRSLASISKYERGDCAIDCYSLHKIAEALNVTTAQLLPERKLALEKAPAPITGNGITQCKLFYLYNIGYISQNLCCNVLEIDWEKNEVTMYVDINAEHKEDYRQCNFVLHGTVVHTNACTSIWVNNPIAQIDYFHIVINGADWFAGRQICHVSYSTLNWRVVAAKGLFTTHRENLQLIKELLSFSKQEMSDIRKKNIVLF